MLSLLIIAACVSQLMLLGFVGALFTGVIIWDHDFQQKMEILFWIFTALFGLPCVALAIGLSERVWYRASGAKRMVDDLRKSA